MDKEAREELGTWIEENYKKLDKIEAVTGAEQLYKSGKLAGLKEVYKEFCIGDKENEKRKCSN